MDTGWFLCWPKRTEKYPGMDRLNYPSRWCFLCPYLLSSYCVVSAWFRQLSADFQTPAPHDDQTQGIQHILQPTRYTPRATKNVVMFLGFLESEVTFHRL